MSIPTITTGDDVSIAATLTKDGASFTIDPGDTVEASIVSRYKSTVLISPVAQSSSANGADWANSLVVVNFTSAQTAVDFAGLAFLEVQVDDGTKQTFFSSIKLVKGTIA